jgi:[ribosomal protein S18]-alanine N-acetyltransferase
MFHFKLMTITDARELLSWRYEEPYTLYNIVAQPGKEDELLSFFADPNNQYYSITNDDGVMVASCCFGGDAQVRGGDYSTDAIDVGVGTRPDLTGQGHGHLLVGAILGFGRQQFQPTTFRATIAGFNQRSQRTFIKLGFQQTDRFVRASDLREFRIFMREERP